METDHRQNQIQHLLLSSLFANVDLLCGHEGVRLILVLMSHIQRSKVRFIPALRADLLLPLSPLAYSGRF